MIDQLTIRKLGPDLSEKIENLAEREGISLNKALLKLARRGAGLEAAEPKRDVIGNSLDWFIGSATEEDTRELEEAMAWFGQIDEEMWR
ncbi:MAG TPA: hypothetical protein VF017_02815 [Thermoanaerobaculia bacterium]|nr:hypothetical protein [Thermoanaerobaculia bacterium]